MTKSHKHVGLKLLLLPVLLSTAFTGCQKRTKLLVEAESAGASRIELASMFKMLGISGVSLDNEGNTVTAVFPDVLSGTEKSKVEEVLKRIVGATPKNPSFDIEITETDTEVLEVLELESKTQKKTSLDIDFARGEHKLLSGRGIGLGGIENSMMAERQCVWAIPLKSKLPTLTYQKTINSPAEDDPSESEARKQLRDTVRKLFDNLVLTADHKIGVNDAAFNKWAEAMQLDLEDHIYFDFGSQTGVTNVLGGPGTAFLPDFEECAQTVLAKSDNLFLGTFIFPTLCANLKSYRFEESRF